MQSTPTVSSSSPVAVLVGVYPTGSKKQGIAHRMQELSALAETYGFVIDRSFAQQLAHPDTATWVGKGKLAEIGTYLQALQQACPQGSPQDRPAVTVLLDGDVTPNQLSALRQQLKVPVWERCFLILEIFAKHARTAEAMTQVELAQQEYLLAHLTRRWSHLSRQQGGSGGAAMKGPGEKELETDRRVVQQRIAHLKEKLADYAKQVQNQRKQQRHQFQVALVGYTNAGKSTLMQTMAKCETYVANQLFATLSTMVRKVVVENEPFLLVDTVGFIHDLPHQLIASFRSTLQAVTQADLLLHVVDASNPNFPQQIEVVEQTLAMIGAGNLPTLLLLNKVDRLDAGQREALEQEALAREKVQYCSTHVQQVMLVSATQPESLHLLRTQLSEEIRQYKTRRYQQP